MLKYNPESALQYLVQRLVIDEVVMHAVDVKKTDLLSLLRQTVQENVFVLQVICIGDHLNEILSLKDTIGEYIQRSMNCNIAFFPVTICYTERRNPMTVKIRSQDYNYTIVLLITWPNFLCRSM